MKKTLLFFACALACMCAQSQTRYVGGDISMLTAYEQHNSAYKDVDNTKINDLVTWAVEKCGWNTFRVRIFVNPACGNDGVIQTTEYVAALGQRIKAAGAYFMLDFHYSDTWVDAMHIQAPAAWQQADAQAMADSVADYTRRTLERLVEANATPDLVQVGNEIMYGVCGIKISPYDNPATESNWPDYIRLLQAGCNTVREICPNAHIIIHTDRPNEVANTQYYYTRLIEGGVDFDIIGLSYYPFWHGYLTAAQNSNNLVKSISSYSAAFPDKRIHIVECAYNFQYWPNNGVNYDTQSIWPATKAGQYAFVKDLVDALKPLEHLDGINYWFPEEAGNGDDTNWSTSDGSVYNAWLNRGFWSPDASTNGHPINKTGNMTDGKTAADVCAPYYLGTFLNENSEDIEPAPISTNSIKHIEDDRLVILYGAKRYSVSGQAF